VVKQSGRLGKNGRLFWGLLNPAIAFAALLTLLYAVYLQRLELSRMKKAMDEQIFDSKFYSALTLYTESIGTLTYESNGKRLAGYEAIRACFHDLIGRASAFADNQMKTSAPPEAFQMEFDLLLSGYTKFYLGSATPHMVVSRIEDIAGMIERSPVDRRNEYHQMFAAYLSLEMKMWIYLFLTFNRNVAPPGRQYANNSDFWRYMQEVLPFEMTLPKGLLGYMSKRIVEEVIQKQAKWNLPYISAPAWAKKAAETPKTAI
jgi:hypothetical protein